MKRKPKEKEEGMPNRLTIGISKEPEIKAMVKAWLKAGIPIQKRFKEILKERVAIEIALAEKMIEQKKELDDLKLKLEQKGNKP